MLARVYGKGGCLITGSRNGPGKATMEISGEIPQDLKLDLPNDPLMGIYPQYSTSYYRDTSLPIFIAVIYNNS